MAIRGRVLAAVAAATLLLSACSELEEATTDPPTEGPSSGTAAASSPAPPPATLDQDDATSTGDQDMQASTGDQDQQTSTQAAPPPDTDISTSTASGSPTAGPSEAPADEALPAFAAEAVEQSGDDDALLLPTTVRLGLQDGYDRVVFDLEGDSMPGYRVGYVDQAVQDGSGRIIDVSGDAILQVVISGTRYPDEDEAYQGGPGTYTLDSAEVVEEVRASGTFEGLTQAFIGIDDEGSPFRVFTLSGPPRLVVDIQHPAN